MLIYLTIFGGIRFKCSFGILLARPVSIALGASGDLLDYCTLYGRITFLSLTPFMLQMYFSAFCHGGKTKTWFTRHCSCRCYEYGTGLPILSLCLGMGLVGAAIATVCGECIGGFVPLIYFAAKNSSPFCLGKTKWYPLS